ncbi:MAG: hypothetical protein V1817_03055 [Candidatus Micrarchaeota archaeon]
MEKNLIRLFSVVFAAFLLLAPLIASVSAEEFVVGPLDSVKISTVGLDKPVQLVATADAKTYSFPKAVEITLAYGNKNSLTRDYVAETIKATKITFSKDAAVPQSLSAPANPAATIDLKSLKNAESKKIRVATEKLFSQTLSPSRITLPPGNAYCNTEIVSTDPAVISPQNKPSTLTFNFKQFVPINVIATDGKESHFLANKIVLTNAQNAEFDWKSAATVIASLCASHYVDNFYHYGVDVKAAEDKSKSSAATFQTLSNPEATGEEKLLKKFEVNAKKERLQVKYELTAASDFKIKIEPVVYDAAALKTLGFTESDYREKYTPDFKTVPMKIDGKNSVITVNEKGLLYSVAKAYFDKKKKLSETLEWEYATSQEASQDKKTIATKKIFAGTYSLSALTKGGVIESQKTVDLNDVGLENPEVTQVLLDKERHEKRVGDYYYKIFDYTTDGKVALGYHKEKEKYEDAANYVPRLPNTLSKVGNENDLYVLVTPYAADSNYFVLSVYRGKQPNAIREPVVTPVALIDRGQACSQSATPSKDDYVDYCVKQWKSKKEDCAKKFEYSGLQPSVKDIAKNYYEQVGKAKGMTLEKSEALLGSAILNRGNCMPVDASGRYALYCVQNFASKGASQSPAGRPEFICAAVNQIPEGEACYAITPASGFDSECAQTGFTPSHLCKAPYDVKLLPGLWKGTCQKTSVSEKEKPITKEKAIDDWTNAKAGAPWGSDCTAKLVTDGSEVSIEVSVPVTEVKTKNVVKEDTLPMRYETIKASEFKKGVLQVVLPTSDILKDDFETAKMDVSAAANGAGVALKLYVKTRYDYVVHKPLLESLQKLKSEGVTKTPLFVFLLDPKNDRNVLTKSKCSLEFSAVPAAVKSEAEKKKEAAEKTTEKVTTGKFTCRARFTNDDVGPVLRADFPYSYRIEPVPEKATVSIEDAFFESSALKIESKGTFFVTQPGVEVKLYEKKDEPNDLYYDLLDLRDIDGKTQTLVKAKLLDDKGGSNDAACKLDLTNLPKFKQAAEEKKTADAASACKASYSFNLLGPIVLLEFPNLEKVLTPRPNKAVVSFEDALLEPVSRDLLPPYGKRQFNYIELDLYKDSKNTNSPSELYDELLNLRDLDGETSAVVNAALQGSKGETKTVSCTLDLKKLPPFKVPGKSTSVLEAGKTFWLKIRNAIKEEWRKETESISQAFEEGWQTVQQGAAKVCKLGSKLVTKKSTQKTACVPESMLGAGQEGEPCIPLVGIPTLCDAELECVDGVCKRVSSVAAVSPTIIPIQGSVPACDVLYARINQDKVTEVCKQMADKRCVCQQSEITPVSKIFECGGKILGAFVKKATLVCKNTCECVGTFDGKTQAFNMNAPDYAQYLYQ